MPWGSPVVLPREPENPWSAALRQLTMNAALQHMKNVQSTRASEAQRAFQKEQGELERISKEKIAGMRQEGADSLPSIIKAQVVRKNLMNKDPEGKDEQIQNEIKELTDFIHTEGSYAPRLGQSAQGYFTQDPNTPGGWRWVTIGGGQQPTPGTSPGMQAQKLGPAPPAEEGTRPIPIQADPELKSTLKTAEEEAKFKVKQKREMFPKARDQFKSLNRKWDLMEEQIDRALEQVSPFTAGVGSWLSVIPGTAAKDLEETLKSIQANVGFDTLGELRQNSPTGGALGQVSDLENKLMQAVRGSTDQKQSPPQLRKNLATIKSDLQKLRAQKDFAFNYDFSDVSGSKKPEEQSDGKQFTIIKVE